VDGGILLAPPTPRGPSFPPAWRQEGWRPAWWGFSADMSRPARRLKHIEAAGAARRTLRQASLLTPHRRSRFEANRYAICAPAGQPSKWRSYLVASATLTNYIIQQVSDRWESLNRDFASRWAKEENAKCEIGNDRCSSPSLGMLLRSSLSPRKLGQPPGTPHPLPLPANAGRGLSGQSGVPHLWRRYRIEGSDLNYHRSSSPACSD